QVLSRDRVLTRSVPPDFDSGWESQDFFPSQRFRQSYRQVACMTTASARRMAHGTTGVRLQRVELSQPNGDEALAEQAPERQRPRVLAGAPAPSPANVCFSPSRPIGGLLSFFLAGPTREEEREQ